MTRWLYAFRYECAAARRTRSLKPRPETNRPEIKFLKLDKAVSSTASTLSAFSALFISGCMVGPKYHGPPAETTADLPGKYKNGTTQNGHWKTPEPRDTEGAGDWWRIFSDPTLARLESQAVAGNQNIRLSIDRIDDAQAQMRIAAADLYPNLALSWSGTKARTTSTGPVESARIVGSASSLSGGGSSGGSSSAPMPVYSGSSGPVFSSQPISMTAWDFRLPAELRWELDLFGRVRRNVEAARAQTEQARADFEAALLSITANVAAQYFTLHALDAQIAILERAISTRESYLRIAEERLAAGLVNELDVARARSELATNQADLYALRRSRGEIENAIGTLLGEPASNLRLPAEGIASAPPAIPAGLPSRLLERRPDVASAERSVAAANARIGAAIAAFFPDVTINGASGFETANIGDMFAGQSLIWSVGPSVSVPIFEGFRLRAGVESAKAQYRETVENYRGQVLNAFQDVENALIDLRTLAGQWEAQQSAVDSAQRTLDLSRAQYEKGAVTYLDVLDAERTLLADQEVSAQLSGARLQASVQLIKALGGRWGREYNRPKAPVIALPGRSKNG
ncbi:MAG: efflux transporter outer membrane subunit [Verrucomicrobia bacterium]|nr:efflux transporter outer membrane subunit [Verrucomicrobiota bacterium]